MKHKLDVTINELRLKSIRKIVKRINTWSDEVKSYSDDALKQKTIEFKERLASGVDTLDNYYLKLMQWHVKRAGEY